MVEKNPVRKGKREKDSCGGVSRWGILQYIFFGHRLD